jgi:uncharacterized protein (DUF1697 family)
VATYVALLRAINLGARNQISMPDLRALFDDLGAGEVNTYVQTGNVVFSYTPTKPEKLAAAIQGRIGTAFGLDVTVLVRTRRQMENVAAGNPFLGGGRDPAKLHVTFLTGVPEAARTRELAGVRFPPDEFRIAGQEVYLHCPDGYGRSKLSNAFFERRLGAAATTRNWKTVTSLVSLTGA